MGPILTEVVEPYYSKPEAAGRRPVSIECMLRIHFLQHWFDLPDPSAEEALYDSRAVRQFGFAKVHYRGLAKNAHFLFVNCALINLVRAKRRLLRLAQTRCA